VGEATWIVEIIQIKILFCYTLILAQSVVCRGKVNWLWKAI